MDDISRRDRMLFVKELFAPGRLFWLVLFVGAACLISSEALSGVEFVASALWWTALVGGVHAVSSYREAARKRFCNPRFKALWSTCEDRLKRFHEALKALRKNRIAEFEELPKTIQNVAHSLYLAIRRADLVSHEIGKSEGWLQCKSPPVFAPPPADPQATELYRIADKNIAEYRQNYAAVIAGVQRTEAQAAVFTTTLDTLRLKMLGYRLAGRKPEMSSQDFLEAMTEAKLQLKAIDRALDELELGPFPKMVAAMPPTPEEAVVEQRLGGGQE